MSLQQKIRMILAYKGISQAELARLLNTSPQNLSQKIKKNVLTTKDLEEIGNAINAEFFYGFEFKDGNKF